MASAAAFRVRAKRRGGLRQLHRWLGLSAAVFLVFLALTGLALNHSEQLGLREYTVKHSLLAPWRKVPVPEFGPSFRAGDAAFTQLGSHLYRNAEPLAETDSELVGAARIADYELVATHDEVYLLDAAGELLEILGAADGVPRDIDAIAAGAGALVIRTAGGGIGRLDLKQLHWQAGAPGAHAWVQPRALPETLRSALLQRYRGAGLPLDRVLLDLHSGRFLGRWGVVFVDGVALLAVVLALSGIWMWVARR